MEFIDKNNVIKSYDIPNVYLRGYVLQACDKNGDTTAYDGYDQIHYKDGRILTFPFDKPIRKANVLSGYYKVSKKEDIL
ncbi:hypothetical protein TETAKXXN_CDS0035 [Staphylococcus phage PG-2021_17]